MRGREEWGREGEGEGEGERDWFVILCTHIHSKVDSCMCRPGIEPTILAYQGDALTNGAT